MSERGPAHQSWYVARDGKQLGPYASDEFLRLAETGQLRADDLIWSPGFDSWKPLHAVVGAVPTSGASPDGAVQPEPVAEPSLEPQPGAMSTPRELEPTWKRVIAVWWLILWRSMAAGFLAGFAISFFFGFILEFAGYEELEIRAITTILGWIAGLAVLLPVVMMALKKHYKEFRLALVPHDTL